MYILNKWLIDKNRTVNDREQEKGPEREMKVWENGIWTTEIKCVSYRCLGELLSQISIQPVGSWHYWLALRQCPEVSIHSTVLETGLVFSFWCGIQLPISHFLANHDKQSQREIKDCCLLNISLWTQEKLFSLNFLDKIWWWYEIKSDY